MGPLEGQRLRIASRSLPLTRAETRVLHLLPTHLTIQAIADELECKRSTAKTHVAHIYEKLGVSTRGEAVAQARRVGLLGDRTDGSARAQVQGEKSTVTSSNGLYVTTK